MSDFYIGQLLLMVRVRRYSYHIMLIALFSPSTWLFLMSFPTQDTYWRIMEWMGGNSSNIITFLTIKETKINALFDSSNTAEIN